MLRRVIDVAVDWISAAALVGFLLLMLNLLDLAIR